MLSVLGPQVGWSTLETNKKLVEMLESHANPELLELTWRKDVLGMLNLTMQHLDKSR